MSQKVSLKISPSVAACVREGTPKVARLMAARGEVPLSACDLATTLIILSQDSDPEVKGAAVKGLREIPEALAVEIAAAPDTHPRILDILGRLHFNRPAVVELLRAHPALEPQTRALLDEKCAVTATGAPQPPLPAAAPVVEGESAEAPEEESPPEGEPVDEESEEFLSKYQLAQSMGIGDKIKVALTGDKEWRTLLIRDSNKLVSGSVVKNPRITEAEVLTIVKSTVQNDEILRIICMNKEWVKNYNIRKALALNTKTPLPNALRYLSTLTEKDLAALAKSKNISTVISTQARRLLLSKSKK
jgi:hypothetical protein